MQCIEYTSLDSGTFFFYQYLLGIIMEIARSLIMRIATFADAGEAGNGRRAGFLDRSGRCRYEQP